MARRSNGGIIGIQNLPSTTVASGGWSVNDQQQSNLAHAWPGGATAQVPNAPSFSSLAVFTASITARQLNVTSVSSGTLAVGQFITGSGVAQFTTIDALIGGSGGTGSYQIGKNQTASSTTMTAILQYTSITSTTCSVVVPFTTGYDGGSPITGVTVTIYQGGVAVGSATGTTSPLTITGVPVNAASTISMYATNAVGNSPVSSGPNLYTPAVPTIAAVGTVTSSNLTASVPFTVPQNTNGSAVTSYTAKAYVSGVYSGISATGTTSPISVTGLSGNTTYTFTVYATNAVGNGPESSQSNSITTPNVVSVQALIVGGGGGAGASAGSGGGGSGGGAGGVIANTFVLTPGTTYTVTVGAGGTGSTNLNSGGGVAAGGNGGNSVVSGSGLTTQTAIGGGGGQAGNSSLGSPTWNAGNGGSGGGGYDSTNGYGQGTAGQGNNGGVSYDSGGGGAGGTGFPISSLVGGDGGLAISSTITGSTVYYAGGGGGGNTGYTPATAGGLGGHTATTAQKGGAGDGGTCVSGVYGTNGTAGTANTGGGAGGPGFGAAYHTPPYNTSNAGGSGVVIFSAPQAAVTVTGSPTVTTSGGNTIYTFTGSGTIKY
jgi:hypothetical protein